MMIKFTQLVICVVTAAALSGCVTQNFEDGKTPVVENDANSKEIAMTRIQLGLGYLKIGNTAQAKLNLEKAKRVAPKLVAVHTAFAHYYETVGEAELATTAYQQALSIDDADADTLNNFGVFLCRQDKYDEAEQQFLKAIAVPSYILVAKSYENLALCQLEGERYIKAEQYLEKAILHSPSSASTLLQMVRLQYAKGDYKSAQANFSRFEKATRRFNPNALALAYKVYEKQHNRRIAKNYAAMLVKMFPNSYEAQQYILNGLAKIEADELAEKYQTVVNGVDKKAKKRVVVLSPKKTNDEIITKKAVVKSTEKVKSAKTNVAKIKQPTTKKTLLSEVNKTQETAKKLVAEKQIKPAEKKIATSTDNSGQKMLTIPIHIVKKGDSMFSISKKYNIHMKAIMRWNNIKKSKILRIGDVIYLDDPRKAAKS